MLAGIAFVLIGSFAMHVRPTGEAGLVPPADIMFEIRKVVSPTLIAALAVTIVLILVITAVLLTGWIWRGMLDPISQLNVALQRVAEGDLNCQLDPAGYVGKGEIETMVRNYEDMRLRLKETQDEMMDHEHANRELISNISHDLKTPITSVKGYVEGIMDGVADTPEKMDRYIRTIYNKANDMDKLINELTLYAGIDTNRIPYNFHRINIAEYFGDCIEEVGLDLESRNIRLD